MKEHGSKLPAEQPVKMLKSLLKKPGQTRTKSQKNRVVINEKLNEFFAADYIILIKEVCCAEYEEDCDCCCQEYELIRLGNCKECRAELNLHFEVADNEQYEGMEKDEELIEQSSFDEQNCPGEEDNYTESEIEHMEQEDSFGNEYVSNENTAHNSHVINSNGLVNIDDGIDENIGNGAAVDEGSDKRRVRISNKLPGDGDVANTERNVTMRDCRDEGKSVTNLYERHGEVMKEMREAINERQVNTGNSDFHESGDGIVSPPSPLLNRDHQQETLSPPEGYKDVCNNQTCKETEEHCSRVPHCDYYHHQRHSNTEMQTEVDGNCEGKELYVGDTENEQHFEKSSTIELPHRYLVETITMTTVTERRIVREISEEDEAITHRRGINLLSEESGIGVGKTSIEDPEEKSVGKVASSSVLSIDSESTESDNTTDHDIDQRKDTLQSESIKELSLVFKLGSSSLASNSLKPNSAVRQLFPNPKFMTVPRTNFATGKSGDCLFHGNMTADTRGANDIEDNDLENDLEDESSLLRKTIERNTLRRSLIGKYRAAARKKSLQSKNLSLEERIRQLTCVDQEEETQSEPICPTSGPETFGISSGDDVGLIRSSVSREERPTSISIAHNIPAMMPATTIARLESTSTIVTRTVNTVSGNAVTRMNVPANTTTITTTSRTMTGGIPAASVTSMAAVMTTASSIELLPNMDIVQRNLHKQNTVSSPNTEPSHLQSTYKKLADFFVHKKSNPSASANNVVTAANPAVAVLPDLGGPGQNNKVISHNRECQGKNTHGKINTDVQRQFLASLAPLSCVPGKNVDFYEDYHTRHTNHTKMTGLNSRNTIRYSTESSYSHEEIEAALASKESRRYSSPPDVTRGTPVGTRLDIGDNAADELLAFVEQDKSRMERIKRRYSEYDDNSVTNQKNNNNRGERIVEGNARTVDNIVGVNDKTSNNVKEKSGSDIDNILHNIGNGSGKRDQDHERTDNDERQDDKDDDDDELNDYGFNKRPAVRGIKPQLNTNDSARSTTLLNSNAAENTFPGRKVSVHTHLMPTGYYEKPGELDGSMAHYDEITSTSSHDISTDAYVNALLTDERDANTINRINTMQKQIDDIYQTIAESTMSTQPSLEREPYLDSSTFPRMCGRPQPQPIASSPSVGQNIPNVRIPRAVNPPSDELPGVLPATESNPGKLRRGEAVGALSNYSFETASSMSSNTGRCYRTMYFVPYNGVSDPTYQNIQTVFPVHSATNYASLDRYPRVNKSEQHHCRLQQQQLQPRTLPTQNQPGNILQPQAPQAHPQLQQQQPLTQYQYQARYHAPNQSVAPVTNLSNSPSTLLPSAPVVPRFNTVPAGNPLSVQTGQQTLHLHLHHHQPPDDVHISSVAFSTVPHTSDHSLQLHHHQHYRHQHPHQHQHHQQHQHPHRRHNHQTIPYHLETAAASPSVSTAGEHSSAYTVIAPTRCAPFTRSSAANTQAGYHLYQVHVGTAALTPTTDILSQSFAYSVPVSSAERNSLSFDGGLTCSSSSSASSASSSSSFCSLSSTSASSSSASSSSIAGSAAVCATTTSAGSAIMTNANLTGLPCQVSDNVYVRTDFNGQIPMNDDCNPTVISSNRCNLNNSTIISNTNTSSFHMPGSPTKQNRLTDSYAVAERGVPEGAASAPSDDVTSAQPFLPVDQNSHSLLESHALNTHTSSGSSLSSHVQNSIYYAMNV